MGRHIHNGVSYGGTVNNSTMIKHGTSSTVANEIDSINSNLLEVVTLKTLYIGTTNTTSYSLSDDITKYDLVIMNCGFGGGDVSGWTYSGIFTKNTVNNTSNKLYVCSDSQWIALTMTSNTQLDVSGRSVDRCYIKSIVGIIFANKD